jgi:formylglycine-generating enzyme required for sulfatase activity
MRIRSPYVARRLLSCGAMVLTAVSPAFGAVDFETEIKPIIESACLHCHQEGNAEGDLRLDSLAAATMAGDRTPAIVPGDAAKSPFYTVTVLPPDDEQIMPPDGPPLDESQTRLLRQWINEGAKWPSSVKLDVQPRIDFVENVQPILETHCVSCHSGENAEGDFNLSTHQSALQSGSNPPSIVPYHAEKSPLYAVTVVEKDDATLMPPLEQGGPLNKEMTATLRFWINQGAIWPTGVTLKTRPKIPTGEWSPDNLELVRKIHALIVQREHEEDMKFADYTAKIPRTGVPYEMVAIKGGDFLMGSPPQEKGRQDDEGPQAQVHVDSFWIGKHEVTWDEFEPFMITRVERFKNGTRKDYDPATHTIVDAVSGPTAPYADMSFGMGRRGYPAICMTQHAANKYCQWLSAQTGHFYRLPTEAEWEYACRAGTTTAYSFGDDPEDLDQYSWYGDNSEEKSQPVGKKKPNAWGLYDMHGNVMEWTEDRFDPDYFRNLHGRAENPFARPDALYPRSVRGGSWNDGPEQLRSAYRRGSERMWQQRDPQLPKSIWYLTDAPWLGFRIARPRKIPSVEEMYFYWNSSTGKL